MEQTMIMRMSTKSQFKAAAEQNEWAGLDQTAKPTDLTLPHGAEICATGLTMPENLDLEQWQQVGIKLVEIDSGIQWALGDWWCHGHHTYGSRTAEVGAKKLRYEFSSLMNLGSTARKVPPSLRNEAVSHSHHVAVQGLEPEAQTKWLTKAAKMHWSVKTLREKIKEYDERDPVKEAEYEQEQRELKEIPDWASELASELIRCSQQSYNWRVNHPATDFRNLPQSYLKELLEALQRASINLGGFAKDLAKVIEAKARDGAETTVKRERVRLNGSTEQLHLQAAE
jgi:hypothetical protein